MDTDVIVSHGRMECVQCFAVDVNDTHFNGDGMCLTRGDLTANLKTRNDRLSEDILANWQYPETCSGVSVPRQVPRSAEDDPAKQCFMAELAYKRGTCSLESLTTAVTWLLSVFAGNTDHLSPVRKQMVEAWTVAQFEAI